MGARLIVREALLGLLLVLTFAAFAAVPSTFRPAQAVDMVPQLVEAQRDLWPAAPEPWTLAGLVEQESCISLTHRKCWNPYAELKTSREYGFGLGQITRAYRADGSVRFDKFQELRDTYPALAGWAWQDRFRADYQLKAMVSMTQGLWSRTEWAATDRDQWAFVLSAYNGGLGHVFQDRRLCAQKDGCDPARWFDNVELDSVKSRRELVGYGGQSPFSINRKYPRNVLDLRRDKYMLFWSEG